MSTAKSCKKCGDNVEEFYNSAYETCEYCQKEMNRRYDDWVTTPPEERYLRHMGEER